MFLWLKSWFTVLCGILMYSVQNFINFKLKNRQRHRINYFKNYSWNLLFDDLYRSNWDRMSILPFFFFSNNRGCSDSSWWITLLFYYEKHASPAIVWQSFHFTDKRGTNVTSSDSIHDRLNTLYPVKLTNHLVRMMNGIWAFTI